MTTDTTLRALVVGTGFGCRIQVPALRGAGFEVAGLVGANASQTVRRAADNGVARSFTDLDEAIDATGASVVAISTPPATHAALALAALARGRHVLCEKPFAANAAEARAMRETAERVGAVHMVGHEFRFVPQRALVRRTIGAGLIGAPKFLSIVQFSGYVASFASNLPAWWFDPAAGGGWLGASASHIIDQIRTEVGEFDQVSAALPKVSAQAGAVEDSYVVRFRLSNGAEGVLQQTAGAHGPAAGLFRIEGDKGALWTEGEAVWLADQDGARALPVPEDLMLPPAPPASTDPRQAGVEWRFLTAIELAPYTRLCQLFKAAIEGRPAPEEPRPATFADGLACMRVIDAIRASAAADGAVVAVS